MKICVIGCGLRTPLLIHGLVRSNLNIQEVVLYDINPARASLMAALDQRLAADTGTNIRATNNLTDAVQDANFVLNSVRVGDMNTRAAEERLALYYGSAGQETTGPTGMAMALRTIPVALEHARLVERNAPNAWIINFTNPAGIITQAIATHTGAKVVGICDTPAELFYQIAQALHLDPAQVQCDYFGLNHLGWMKSIRVASENVMPRVLGSDEILRRLYPTELFPLEFLRTLELIPTEYLYFYYDQQTAVKNQLRAGSTRGEELETLNKSIWAELHRTVELNEAEIGLIAYRNYLNRRNSSYMRLEGAGESVRDCTDSDWNPFEGVTGYHRIAVDAIAALTSVQPVLMILNVRNKGAIHSVGQDDVVEVPCLVDYRGSRPLAVGNVPTSVQGLITSVKQYERLTIEAAAQKSWDLATLALTINPIVGGWNSSRDFLKGLAARDQHFSLFR